MALEKIIMAWSSGKDSAFTLCRLLNSGLYQVCALLTTITADYDRISMHGVRRELLEKQAESLGLPLELVQISKTSGNQEYETKMGAALQKYQAQGVSRVAFGDLFLEGIREYREKNLAAIDMKALFPLWGLDTKKLGQSFVDAGFKTIITCVDTTQLDKSWAGREYDQEFLRQLPAKTDPCGENGEFHSFTYDGPIFKQPVLFKPGEKVMRDDRFFFCDLLPG